MFHTPWYNSNDNHYEEGLKHQWDMEELFHKHGVDLVLNGHVHSYERSHPVYKHKNDPCGAVHVVIGDAGNYEGPAIGWKEPQPSWSAFRESSFGAGSLTVYNCTHSSWEWQRTACVSKPAGQSYYSWESHAVDCSTAGDNSQTAFAPADTAMLLRDVASCPNRAVGRRLAISSNLV